MKRVVSSLRGVDGVNRAGVVRRRLRAAAGASVRAMIADGGAAAARPEGTLDRLESRVMLSANDVVINEIMYNSASLETADEYVELYNKGTTPVDLTGWKLSKGADYTFGARTLGAGQYLVVAADLARFAQKYPTVGNVVGPWTGHLSNNADSLKLSDAAGNQIDQVDYASDGDWAVRRRGGEAYKAVTSATSSGTTATFNVPAHGYAVGNKVAVFGANQAPYDGLFTIVSVPNANSFTVTLPSATAATATGQVYVRRADFNHFGWDWFNPSDGGGKSLELINPNLSNNAGQNWGPSVPTDGTPGAPNSIAAANVAPLVENVGQFPLIPKSSDQVTVTAKITDELVGGITAQVFFRDDGAGSFTSLQMFDDGLHGDGSAGDGVYGAKLPARPNNTIVEFYVKATDASNNSRTSPGPTDVTGVQQANALYQVDDTPYSGKQPLFKIIMTAAEANELATLRGTSDDNSNAAMNGTWVSVDGTGSEIRYQIGVRNRGGGSRSLQSAAVANYRVNFYNFNPWHKEVKINLNGIYSVDEVVGNMLAARAGVPGQLVTPVQVRVNNVNFATNGTNLGMFGSYSYVEDEDKNLVSDHFPTDDQGNYYRGIDGGHNAGLQYLGEAASAYMTKYPKETNKEVNDYTDLINLTKALDPSFTPDANFAAAVNANIDVDEWMRYFAFNVLVGNGETSIGTGYGDDYALYRGINDPHFQLIAHDLDTVLNFGDTQVSQNRSIFVATNVATIKRLLQSADFAPRYFKALKEMIDTVWTPAELTRTIHHALDGYVSSATVDGVVNDAIARAAAALAQIPLNLTVTSTPAAVNGYPQVTNAAQLSAMTLGGKANAILTKSILVNGKAATYTPYTGAWSITNAANQLGLQGGLNRVIVKEMDASNKEVGRTFVDIWYSLPAGTNVSGAITTATTWSPANGPYHVTANVTVNAGASLTIQPGTTVYFAAGTRLTVNGLLNAVGAETQRIRFSKEATTSGTNSTWAGIYFSNTSQANKLAYADVEYAGVGGPDTQLANSVVDLDHDTWASNGAGQRIIDVTGNANFSLTNSVVGSLRNQELIHYDNSGTMVRALIQGNLIGTTTNNSPSSKNDIIDFTGGNRPGAIVQFLDNVFVGTGTTFGDGDDFLDLDGTDAHIEGNLFMNLGHSSTADTNSAISGGGDSGHTSEVVSTRNFFYNVDHAFLMKEGNFITSVNDTFVNVITAPFNFSEPGFAATPGLGGYADGDVFYNSPVDAGGRAILVENAPTGTFTVRHSITPGSVAYPGAGNLAGGAQLVNPNGIGLNNLGASFEIGLLGTGAALDASIASHLAPLFVTGPAAPDLSLKPTSPAIGTGPNGVDMGAEIPAGGTISGEPTAPTPFNNLTLTVGGPAIFGYRWKLDGGAYSATVNVTNPMTANAVIPPINLTNLANGPHTVSIQVLNDAGVFQTTTTTSKVFTVNTALAGHVRLNEIIADNVNAFANGSTHPDAIELYNDGKGTIDLSDYSISDDPASPRKFVIPAGTTLAQGQYLTLFADNPSAAPGIHLGFSLSADGEGVYLYNNLSAGGALADSVVFGTQLTDYSIGRVADGTKWALTTPTFGSANVQANVGDPATLKINEWQTAGIPPFSNDFIELYNPDPLPVSIGGMSITDQATGWPDQNVFTPLSFVAGKGFLKLDADGDTGAGANHVNFQLNADRGEIALLDANLKIVDYVFYAAQSNGVSEGLSPDGSTNYVFFNQPTPGVSNPANVAQSVTVNLSKVNDVWHYNQTAQFNDQSWAQPGFNDSTWQSGPGVIYHEDANLPWAKGTELADATHPYNMQQRTYYFRRTFTLADPSAVTALRLNALIDDGAVFYINGHEITNLTGGSLRLGMNAGTVTYSTFANRNVSDASVEGEFLIPPGMLVAGVNTIAVEVHQTGTNSSDITFGMTLDATETITAPPTPPLRVSELMYNPPGSADVVGDEYEYIEFQNTGSSPLNLLGYKLTAGVDFTFGNVTLAPGQKTVVVKNLDAFTARYGNGISIAGQYVGSLDNGGETIRVETPENFVVQEFNYSNTWYPSTDGKGDSLTINDVNADTVTWNSPTNWHASTAALGTPGLAETAAPAQHAIVTNEVLANSPTGPNDWIELRNTTGAAIDVSGWYLSDSGSNLLKFRIPANTIIPAGGYVVFTEQQDFGNVLLGASAFSLSSTGDDVYLSSSATAGILGAYRDAAHFGASDPGVTMGRYQTSTGRTDFVALAKPTQGAANAPAAAGPVVINELMYHPQGSGDEYIEIKNVSTSTVPLYDPANPANTWHFTNGVDFAFPTGLSLAPGEIMIVIPSTISVADFRTKYGIPAGVQVVGGYGGALSNGGEHVELSKPGLPQPDYSIPYVLVDDVDYGTGTPWPASPDGNGPALERFNEHAYGNDVANWRASTTVGGTPGAVNGSAPVTGTGQFVELSANQLLIQFSKDVQASLSTADLTLTNLTTGQVVSPGAMSLSYDPNSNIATFTFPGLANGQLATGRYRAVLSGGGVSATSDGALLDGNADGFAGDDYTYDFVHLPGDMNGDGTVDFVDFQKFELKYGKTGATWADGDFNYNGTVDNADFKILMQNIGTTLPPAPAAPVPSAPVSVVVVPEPTPVPVKPTPTPIPAQTPTPTPTPTKPAPKPKPVVVPPAPVKKPKPAAPKPVVKAKTAVGVGTSRPSPFSVTRVSAKKRDGGGGDAVWS